MTFGPEREMEGQKQRGRQAEEACVIRGQASGRVREELEQCKKTPRSPPRVDGTANRSRSSRGRVCEMKLDGRWIAFTSAEAAKRLFYTLPYHHADDVEGAAPLASGCV